MVDNKQIMAQNILYYMEINNKSRTEMCNILNVPYTTFTGWIKAEKYPRIDKIELMANYFGISKSDLVEERSDDADVALLNRLLPYLKKLNPAGVEKAVEYLKDLNPKFYKGEE